MLCSLAGMISMRGRYIGVELQPPVFVPFRPHLAAQRLQPVAVAALTRLTAFLWWKWRNGRACSPELCKSVEKIVRELATVGRLPACRTLTLTLTPNGVASIT